MATVLLVRHADIDLPPSSNDPPLNSAGMERANELVHVAGLEGITAVFTSSLARTKQTVGPLAARLGIQPREVPPPPVFAEEILSGTVGQVVLVAGHSNTVPQMIEALGARRFHSRSANASSTTCSWSPCLVRVRRACFA